MSKASNAFIQKLLDAEVEADKIIQQAKQSRLKKIKDAVSEADEEIEIFRSKEEEAFKEKIKNVTKFGNDNEEDDVNEGIQNIKKSIQTQKAKLIGTITNHVTDIKLQLRDVQKRFMTEKGSFVAVKNI